MKNITPNQKPLIGRTYPNSIKIESNYNIILTPYIPLHVSSPLYLEEIKKRRYSIAGKLITDVEAETIRYDEPNLNGMYYDFPQDQLVPISNIELLSG